MSDLRASVDTAFNAVLGLLMLVAAIFAGLAALVWIMEAPEFFAIIVAASIIAAALYFRKPLNVNVVIREPKP